MVPRTVRIGVATMKDLHDKLFAEVMSRNLQLFMAEINDPTFIMEMMLRTAKQEHERIWVAINFASVYSQGFHTDAEAHLKAYVDSKRPPKPPRRWPWNKRIRGEDDK
jgi:hypothetical protein